MKGDRRAVWGGRVRKRRAIARWTGRCCMLCFLKAFLARHLEQMSFSGLEVPRGTKLWLHDPQFLATAELTTKFGPPKDFASSFAPIIFGDRTVHTRMAWFVQGKGHWLQVPIEVAILPLACRLTLLLWLTSLVQTHVACFVVPFCSVSLCLSRVPLLLLGSGSVRGWVNVCGP